MRWTLALLAAVLLAAPADAHVTRSRMHTFRHVATWVWGDPCDVPTMRIPITRVDDVPGAAARASWLDGSGGVKLNCSVEIERSVTDSLTLCTLVVHEVGHFEVGEGHSADPTNVMHPSAPPFFLCYRPGPVARSYPP